METVTCDNCGDSVEKYPSNISESANYCDSDCMYESRNGGANFARYPELTDPDWIRERHHERGMTYEEIADELGCGTSTVSKRANQHGIETRRVKYAELADTEWLKELNHEKEMRLGEIANLIGCTRSAVGYALRRNDIDVKTYMPEGEENFFWKGGSTSDRYYGPNWQEKRDTIRERDNYECQNCGIDESQLPTELHIHHIQPKKTFDDIERANRESNLVALCQPCHNRWEGIPLKPDNR